MKKYIIFILFGLIWGCRKEPDIVVETVPVDYASTTPDNFLDIVSDITLLPLENRDSLLIGNNNELLVSEGEYYIINNNANKKVFRFSAQGKFLNIIGREGRGPGEYTNIRNVQIKGDTVIIYSFPGIILNCYNRQGEFIIQEKYPDHGVQVHKIKDDLLVYNGFGRADPERLYLYKPASGKSTVFLKSEAKVINITESSPVFYPFEGNIFIREMYCDTVYRYNPEENTLKPYICFDKGKYAIDKNCFTFKDPYAAGDYFLSKGRGMVHRYMENEIFRFVEIFLNKEPDPGIFYGINRKGEKEWKWFCGGDVVYGFFVNTFRLFSNKKMYCIIEPFQLKNVPEPVRAKIRNPQVLEEIGENDNPVIGIITFKEREK